MFDRIIGHETVCELLERSISNNRIAHAYLFCGPAQVGKTTVARVWAEELLGPAGTFSGSLETHPDVTIVRRAMDEETGKEKSEISVEQIRELRSRLAHTSLLPGWKIALILEADTMTAAAANAFLKTLEEPAGKTVIILIARDLRRIPETIRSRAQLLRFQLVGASILSRGLIAYGADRSLLARLLVQAAGRPGRALQFLAEPAEIKKCEQALNRRRELLSEPLHQRIKWIESNFKGAKQTDLALEWHLWRQVFREQLLGKPDPAIARVLRRIDEAEEAVRHHVDVRLAFEYFLC